MSKITRITSDTNVTPDPKRGIDKPLGNLLWEDFGIHIVDDERFFSHETLKLASELYEVAAQQNKFVKPGPINENFDVIMRLSERQESIIKVIHEDIRKMPVEVFGEYLDRLFDKIATDTDIFTAKCSVYSENLESLANDIDAESGFDGSFLEVSHQIAAFASKLESLSRPKIKEALKRPERVGVDVFTDAMYSGTILHEVVKDMMDEE